MAFQFNSDFSYNVDIQDIKLVHLKENKQLTLAYPEAAIFDLLIKGYPYKTMIRMMKQITLLTETHAENLIRDTIDFLIQHNVLEDKTDG